MKKIIMSKEMFDYLINICKSNINEVSGSLNTNIMDDGIYISGVVFANEEIEVGEKHRIKIDYPNFSMHTLYYLNQSNKECYIHFHTHPPIINDCVPSDDDQTIIENIQRLIDVYFSQIKKEDYSKENYNPIYIECIIHRSNLAFWYYDTKTNKCSKCDVLVDGKEYRTITDIPTSNNIIKAFANGIKKGINKSRKK